jgi:outer membrane protein OmpA-like peptidoglycan-associated protein
MSIKVAFSGVLLFVLSGCAFFQPQPPACEKVATASSQKLTFRGLEIPFAIGGVTDKFKIAGFEYDAKQTQTITDAVMALADARQRQCNGWWAMTRAKPPATAAQMLEMQKLFDSSKQSENELVAALAAGNQGRATQAAQDLQKKSIDLPAAMEKVLTSEAPPNTTPQAAVLERIQQIESSLQTLQSRVNSLSLSVGTGQAQPTLIWQAERSFSVTGYPHAAVALTTDMKAKLEQDYQTAVGALRDKPAQNVLVIGFADASGSYLQNVELGRQRAAAVADFLQRRFPSKAQLRIASGGIGEGAQPRRVDVVVS